MKSRKLICAVLVCAMVGVAYGAATKIKSFTTCSAVVAACAEPVDADGMAIINYANVDNKMIIQIVLSGFTPSTTYDVGLIPPDVDPNSYEQGLGGIGIGIDAITTDLHGNANLHANFPGGFTVSNIGIYLPFEIPNPDGSRTRAGVLRALGNP